MHVSPGESISPWQTEALLLITARCYMGTSSWVCCFGLGIPAWGSDYIILRRNPCSCDILSHCPWERGQLFLCLCLSYQAQYGFFCKSLVVRLLFSQSLICYSGRLFFNLVVIPVWSWQEVSGPSIYSATMLKLVPPTFIIFQLGTDSLISIW